MKILQELKGVKGRLTLSSTVISKIKQLLYKLPQTEWGAWAYWELEGEEHKDFNCVVQDIFLTEIGTSGNFSHDTDGSTAQYELNHPELSFMNFGLMHSHHNMQVFFSGEDDAELRRNAANANAYLSVVVNSKGQVVARLCYQLFNGNFFYNDNTGARKELPLNSESSMIVYYTLECDNFLYTDMCEDEEFLSRYDKLNKPKVKKVTFNTVGHQGVLPHLSSAYGIRPGFDGQYIWESDFDTENTEDEFLLTWLSEFQVNSIFHAQTVLQHVLRIKGKTKLKEILVENLPSIDEYSSLDFKRLGELIDKNFSKEISQLLTVTIMNNGE